MGIVKDTLVNHPAPDQATAQVQQQPAAARHAPSPVDKAVGRALSMALIMLGVDVIRWAWRTVARAIRRLRH